MGSFTNHNDGLKTCSLHCDTHTNERYSLLCRTDRHTCGQCIRITWHVCFRRVRKIATSNYWPRHVCLSVRPSAWNNSAPTGRIFIKFDIWDFSKNLSRKFTFHWNRTRLTGTLHEINIHLWWYLDKYYLKWERFQTTAVEKMRTR